jgi:hypothetical protein
LDNLENRSPAPWKAGARRPEEQKLGGTLESRSLKTRRPGKQESDGLKSKSSVSIRFLFKKRRRKK